jgi:hypothetical protein
MKAIALRASSLEIVCETSSLLGRFDFPHFEIDVASPDDVPGVGRILVDSLHKPSFYCKIFVTIVISLAAS